MIRLCKEAQLSEPDFRIDDVFKVIIWRHVFIILTLYSIRPATPLLASAPRRMQYSKPLLSITDQGYKTFQP